MEFLVNNSTIRGESGRVILYHHFFMCLGGGDLLQSAVNRLLRDVTINLPVNNADPDFQIIQYEDDTLLIMQAEMTQVLALKENLKVFSN
jgi:hypothetical protein